MSQAKKKRVNWIDLPLEDRDFYFDMPTFGGKGDPNYTRENLINNIYHAGRLLFERDEVVEFRFTDVYGNRGDHKQTYRPGAIASGWFSSNEFYSEQPQFKGKLLGWERDARGTYWIPQIVKLNPFDHTGWKEGMFADVFKRKTKDQDGKEYEHKLPYCSNDNDVIARRYLLIDIDPVKPKDATKYCSTDEEKLHAYRLFEEVTGFLNQYFPKPISVDSGNGFHAYYRLPGLLNATPQHDLDAISGLLQCLALRYNQPTAKVDTTVYNPSRIFKVPGTMVRKGGLKQDRPYRLSKLINVPDDWETTRKGKGVSSDDVVKFLIEVSEKTQIYDSFLSLIGRGRRGVGQSHAKLSKKLNAKNESTGEPGNDANGTGEPGIEPNDTGRPGPKRIIPQGGTPIEDENGVMIYEPSETLEFPIRVQSRYFHQVRDRAIKYIAKMPESIEGQNGSSKAYAVAVVLVHGFGLDPGISSEIFQNHFNPRCVPEWSLEEIEHKIHDAVMKPHANEYGYLVTGLVERDEIDQEFSDEAIRLSDIDQFIEAFVTKVPFDSLNEKYAKIREIEAKQNKSESKIDSLETKTKKQSEPPFVSSTARMVTAMDRHIEELKLRYPDYEKHEDDNPAWMADLFLEYTKHAGYLTYALFQKQWYRYSKSANVYQLLDDDLFNAEITKYIEMHLSDVREIRVYDRMMLCMANSECGSEAEAETESGSDDSKTPKIARFRKSYINDVKASLESKCRIEDRKVPFWRHIDYGDYFDASEGVMKLPPGIEDPQNLIVCPKGSIYLPYWVGKFEDDSAMKSELAKPESPETCEHPETPEPITTIPESIFETSEIPRKEIEFDPTPNLFAISGIDFVPKMKCKKPDNWFRFLDSIFESNDEQRELLQQWFGYIMFYPTNDFHKMMLLVGPPRAGKGTISRAIQKLMGREYCTSINEQTFSNDFGLANLIGKRLGIFEDARFDSSKNSNESKIVSRLLSISGGDTLPVNRKFKSVVNVNLSSIKIMMCSNELPKLKDASGAFATRWSIIQLTKSFCDKEDIALGRKLESEIQGIFNWSVEGWNKLRAARKFIVPEASKSNMNLVKSAASLIGSFVNDCCVPGVENEVDAAMIYDVWNEYQEANSVKPEMTRFEFTINLKSIVPWIRSENRKHAGIQRRKYVGICLNEDSVKDISLWNKLSIKRSPSEEI